MHESAKAEQPECQTSMSPFVLFCVDFGHYYSRHFHHKKAKSHVVLHFLALSTSLTFRPFPLSVGWNSYNLVSLAGIIMATPADGNVTTVAENEVFDIINFVAIYYENSAGRNAFLRREHFRAEI